MAIISLVFVAISCFVASGNAAASWGYGEDDGPATWGDAYQTCNAGLQSPINIDTEEVEIDYDLPIVDREIFFDPPRRMRISNNGHSIVMSFEKDGYVIRNSSILPFEAKIAQAHFHWGNRPDNGPDNKGSEHTVDGIQYFGELHAVHYNTNYGSLAEAFDKKDGLAVFGWFITADYPQANQAMKHVISLARYVAKHKGSGRIVKPFSLESIIPGNLNEYYRYEGSLTTPPCHESVTWTVFKEPIRISKRQAENLSTKFYEDPKEDKKKHMKKDEDEEDKEEDEEEHEEMEVEEDVEEPELIHNNFRPVQPINGRKVTKPAPLVMQSRPEEIQ